MNFSPADPDLTKQLDPRWVSDCGTWEVGLYRVMFGYKVRAGRVDDNYCCVIDFNVGANDAIKRRGLLATIWFLEQFPPNAKDYEVLQKLPSRDDRYGNSYCPVRFDPVHEDGASGWAQFCRLAVEAHWSAKRPNAYVGGWSMTNAVDWVV